VTDVSFESIELIASVVGVDILMIKKHNTRKTDMDLFLKYRIMVSVLSIVCEEKSNGMLIPVNIIENI
jgi:hypothetical protein